MDYFDKAEIDFFISYDDFCAKHDGRIISTTPRGTYNYSKFQFKPNDAILLGKESVGLPNNVIETTSSVFIEIKDRSLNLSVAGAIILSKALIDVGLI